MFKKSGFCCFDIFQCLNIYPTISFHFSGFGFDELIIRPTEKTGVWKEKRRHI